VIELRDDAVAVIVGTTAVDLPHEAGGILLGYRQQGRTIVTDALAVPSTSGSRDRYHRDDVLANDLLTQWRSERSSDDPVGYVGEWHSHPAGAGVSSIDRAAIRDTAASGRAETALVVFAPWARDHFHGAIAYPGRRLRSTVLSAVVLPERTTASLAPLLATAVRVNGPVFISYRHNDGSEHAEALERLLHASGISVWRDIRDLPPGNTEERIEEAIRAGLSAAILIVTPDIVNSPVVRDREAPRLISLQEQDEKFALVIASSVSRSDGDGLNYDAPDVLLGLAPKKVLNDMIQRDVRTDAGRLEVVKGLLLNRVKQLKPVLASESRPLTISTQSRVETRALDANDADLDIRLLPADDGKLPAALGVRDLQWTLPLVSDAARTAGAKAVQFSGGMHLSIAVALGSAFPETRFGQIEVLDLHGSVWSSSENTSDPATHSAVVSEVATTGPSTGPARLGVFVSLTNSPDDSAFDAIVRSAETPLTRAVAITTSNGHIDPAEGGRLAREIATAIRDAARASSTAEVHLAFHGSYALAILVGRLLNTLKTTVYEWVRSDDGTGTYLPVFTLEPDVAYGPITSVYL